MATNSQEHIDLELFDRELSRYMSGFYRDKFRIYVKWLYIMVLLSVLLIGAIAYLCFTRPASAKFSYASNIATGAVSVMHPLSAPLIKPRELLQWSRDKVLNIYNFNYANYQDIFANLQSSFTNQGWKDFNTTFTSDDFLKKIINSKLFVSALVRGQPKITSEGVLGGSYAWQVEVPIVLSFKAEGQDKALKHDNLSISMILVRVPNFDNAKAIAIDGFSVEESTASNLQ
ncbi:MAG: DotI/IcmL/TraM family protein [Gammaproteobacteria bacterium]|nr:DotI/IcmL/TraM family protein [Gammaproteobacteria bacterium]